jgi:hypothetical protein
MDVAVAMTTEARYEEGLQFFLDHAPSTEELAPYIERMKASGLEYVEANVESDMGDSQMYWEVTIVGDHGGSYTPQDWSDLGVMPQRLERGVEMHAQTNPYRTTVPMPYRIVFSRPDLSLRSFRLVLENSDGRRLDILISRKELAKVLG